jgi:O-antigen ligase
LRFEKLSYSADNPHNQFLTILAEQGIFGWLLLGLLLKSVYQSANRLDKTLLMFGLFISMFENRLASPSYFLTYFILSEYMSQKKL